MLMVVPVPGRDESKNEYQETMKWRDIFEREFGSLFKEWLPKEIPPSEALSKLFVPYVPIWSFGERIPVLEGRREIQDPTSIGAAYLRLATLLGADLDWYAVFKNTGIQELKNTKIELDLKQREYEILRERRRSEQKRYAAVAASLLGLLGAIIGLFVAYKQATTVPTLNLDSLTLQVCIGDSADKCVGAARWADCGTNVNVWARQNGGSFCENPQITKLSDVSGGHCGYATFNIKCSNPAK
jgi:hypothetical protein